MKPHTVTVTLPAPFFGYAQKGGGKLGRTETVTVRLDPRLRYLAELAARKHRRTLSSFIEWVVAESLARVDICILLPGRKSVETAPLSMLGPCLWDVDKAARLAKLAMCAPDLMTHAEQVFVKGARKAKEAKP